jgi:hypothetical protein
MNPITHGTTNMAMRAPTIRDFRSNPKGIFLLLLDGNSDATGGHSPEASTNKNEEQQRSDDEYSGRVFRGQRHGALNPCRHIALVFHFHS